MIYINKLYKYIALFVLIFNPSVAWCNNTEFIELFDKLQVSIPDQISIKEISLNGCDKLEIRLTAPDYIQFDFSKILNNSPLVVRSVVMPRSKINRNLHTIKVKLKPKVIDDVKEALKMETPNYLADENHQRFVNFLETLNVEVPQGITLKDISYHQYYAYFNIGYKSEDYRIAWIFAERLKKSPHFSNVERLSSSSLDKCRKFISSKHRAKISSPSIDYISTALNQHKFPSSKGIYTNNVHSFSIEHGEKYMVDEYYNGLAIYNNKGNRVVVIEVGDASSYLEFNKEKKGKDIFEERSIYSATLNCAADGPDGSYDCIQTAKKEFFTTKSGLLVLKFYQIGRDIRYDVYFTDEGDCMQGCGGGGPDEVTEKTIGPFYSVDITQNSVLKFLYFSASRDELLEPKRIQVIEELVRSVKLN